ncbi:MAG: NAD(P)H-dependent oxidoreductase [Planctomycetota bacterium]
MKVLAFAASSSKTSINRKLVNHVAERYKSAICPEASIESIDLIDYEMPLFRPDRESEEGIPAMAQDFFAKIGEADIVFVSFAEYNGFYTPVYKNLFDWASRINQRVYQDKPMFLMATSPGGRGGANVLKTAADSAPHFGMDVKATFSVPSFQDNFDVEKNQLSNTELDQQLDAELEKLK